MSTLMDSEATLSTAHYVTLLALEFVAFSLLGAAVVFGVFWLLDWWIGRYR